MAYMNNKWVLAGLTSYGTGCARAGYPGIYTRVSSYISFIINVIHSFENGNGNTTPQTKPLTSVKPSTNNARNQPIICYKLILHLLFCLLNIIMI